MPTSASDDKSKPKAGSRVELILERLERLGETVRTCATQGATLLGKLSDLHKEMQGLQRQLASMTAEQQRTAKAQEGSPLTSLTEERAPDELLAKTLDPNWPTGMHAAIGPVPLMEPLSDYDAILRQDPAAWGARPSYCGRRMSECPQDYLVMMYHQARKSAEDRYAQVRASAVMGPKFAAVTLGMLIRARSAEQHAYQALMWWRWRTGDITFRAVPAPWVTPRA